MVRWVLPLNQLTINAESESNYEAPVYRIMAFDNTKDDVGILKQDGSTTVGMMLLRDKDTGTYLYEVEDDDYEWMV